jgi:hypothetical protein
MEIKLKSKINVRNKLIELSEICEKGYFGSLYVGLFYVCVIAGHSTHQRQQISHRTISGFERFLVSIIIF